ncbi:hypothetical protein ABBQ32_007838 [Trebouxia sp. C0010 RCD-2024]
MYSVSPLRTPLPPLWLCRCTATVWCLHDVVCIRSILNSLSNSTLWPANSGSRSALVAQLIQESLAKNLEVRSLSLSETRNIGTPCRLKMLVIRICANSSAPMLFQAGAKCTILESLSQTQQ